MSNRSNETPTDWRSNANKRRTRGLIETTIARIISLHDDKPVAVHMINILRSKGNIVGYKEEKQVVKGTLDGKDKVVTIKVPIYRDPYYIEDEDLLKIVETYEEELDVDALDSAQLEE